MGKTRPILRSSIGSAIHQMNHEKRLRYSVRLCSIWPFLGSAAQTPSHITFPTIVRLPLRLPFRLLYFFYSNPGPRLIYIYQPILFIGGNFCFLIDEKSKTVGQIRFIAMSSDQPFEHTSESGPQSPTSAQVGASSQRPVSAYTTTSNQMSTRPVSTNTTSTSELISMFPDVPLDDLPPVPPLPSLPITPTTPTSPRSPATATISTISRRREVKSLPPPALPPSPSSPLAPIPTVPPRSPRRRVISMPPPPSVIAPALSRRRQINSLPLPPTNSPPCLLPSPPPIPTRSPRPKSAPEPLPPFSLPAHLRPSSLTDPRSFVGHSSLLPYDEKDAHASASTPSTKRSSESTNPNPNTTTPTAPESFVDNGTTSGAPNVANTMGIAASPNQLSASNTAATHTSDASTQTRNNTPRIRTSVLSPFPSTVLQVQPHSQPQPHATSTFSPASSTHTRDPSPHRAAQSKRRHRRRAVVTSVRDVLVNSFCGLMSPLGKLKRRKKKKKGKKKAADADAEVQVLKGEEDRYEGMEDTSRGDDRHRDKDDDTDERRGYGNGNVLGAGLWISRSRGGDGNAGGGPREPRQNDRDGIEGLHKNRSKPEGGGNTNMSGNTATEPTTTADQDEQDQTETSRQPTIAHIRALRNHQLATLNVAFMLQQQQRHPIRRSYIPIPQSRIPPRIHPTTTTTANSQSAYAPFSAHTTPPPSPSASSTQTTVASSILFLSPSSPPTPYPPSRCRSPASSSALSTMGNKFRSAIPTCTFQYPGRRGVGEYGDWSGSGSDFRTEDGDEEERRPRYMLPTVCSVAKAKSVVVTRVNSGRVARVAQVAQVEGSSFV
ncbi:unnamed protein product [Periconia digitata]|uniref:Uncharacterized protein n=1 Tax=Periconia digitata TaxID=1303443 RepID=A0A9W4U335_9PLEO|nr:unnamed protein product [Periconia digitata]